jgi:hypothetical protein
MFKSVDYVRYKYCTLFTSKISIKRLTRLLSETEPEETLLAHAHTT